LDWSRNVGISEVTALENQEFKRGFAAHTIFQFSGWELVARLNSLREKG
jgi:hypothetical protein